MNTTNNSTVARQKKTKEKIDKSDHVHKELKKTKKI